MTKVTQCPRDEEMQKIEKILLAVVAMVFFVLLLLRDSYSIGINKSIFILLAIVCAVVMKVETLVSIFCFLFPLYFGLPGNYMTLILIARMLLSSGKLKFKISSLIFTCFIAMFMLCQNFIMGYTGIVHMMFIAGVVLVLLMFSYQGKYDAASMIYMFVAGVAALGFIMLNSTLNVYELSDLLSSGFRLGASRVNYAEEGIMNVSVDPNFYGMFVVCAFSTAMPYFLKRTTKLFVKLSIAFFLAVSLVVALVGLSRAFVLVFAVWIILFVLFQKNIKSAIMVAIVFALMYVIVTTAMDDVWMVISERFSASDMAGGNGRLRLIIKFFVPWFEEFSVFVFGVGLFACNVHCMPLQFLFGGGIILFILFTGLLLSYLPNITKGFKLRDAIPFLVTFLMMCSIPAAGLLNSMFPLIFVMLLANKTK